MIFSVSASSDRKTYTVVNNTTKKTATLVYDFDNYTATVSGDFCLVPIGLYGFPLPTDLPLSEFDRIGVTLLSEEAITRAGDQSMDYGTTGTYDSSTKTGSLNYEVSFSLGLLQVYVKDSSSVQIPCSGSIESYLTASPVNYTDSTAGSEFTYIFSSDGLSAQCEFPGVNPCLVNSMGVKLVSDHGDAPAYVDVACNENRAYTFRNGVFPSGAAVGWQFDGWYLDQAFQTPAVESQSYTAAKLFAKWTSLDIIGIAEHRKSEDGQYPIIHRETEALLVKTADGGNVETKLQELAHDVGNVTIIKQDALTFDSIPKAGSDNPVTSGGIKAALENKANATHTHSEYAPMANPTFTGSISLGRKKGTTVGSNSVAEGEDTEASGENSHVEGWRSKSGAPKSHAEGHATYATGENSHSEGELTTASGKSSHTEGYDTKAEGDYSHTEGYRTRASGDHSHAEGNDADAIGDNSHAEGYKTGADNFASHAGGHANSPMTGGGAANNTVGDAFVIGNGNSGPQVTILSNCFRVTYAGEVYGLSAFNSTGADYAEYFEWQDSNPEKQDRVGYFVTLDGTEIRVAQPGEYILGIVSGQPCIIGNADEDWLGRWEHDEFGRFVKEDVDTPVTEWREVETTTEDGTRTERVEVPTGEVIHGWRYKANPDYNPAQAYTERKDRPEWSAVGMLGVLSVRDDGTCQVNSFCQVAEGGIATAAAGEFSIIDGQIRKGYRVIERVSDSVVKVIFR